MRREADRHRPEPVFAWKTGATAFAMREAEPVPSVLPSREQMRLGREMLAEAPAGARLVGAFPFDLAEPGVLWVGVPGRLRASGAVAPRSGTAALRQVGEDPDDHFRRFARGALREIDAGAFLKVVASRRFRVQGENPFRPLDVFARLARDRVATAFLCRTPDGTLLGASPETLVLLRGKAISSTPLAGSRPRAEEDRAEAASALLRSAKDRSEHHLVVEHIVAALVSAGAMNVDASGPHLLGTERMWHLATHIDGVLSATDGRLDSLDLVKLLHPTPAVCGTPSTDAFEFIRRHESYSRGLYAGAVGWQDQKGDGHWQVTLRSGLVLGDTAIVTSGAGLVRGSEIEDELSEASGKAATFIDAL